MSIQKEKIQDLATCIRILSAEGVEAANSGHPGMPMGAADYAAVLWSYFLKVNPQDTNWLDRDRFILSAGHGSMLIYSLLHLFGYDLPLEEIKNFRQWDSKTPGHPEFGHTAGVETTTGPLGQGFANGVGMALSERMLAARYSSDVFNHNIYGIVSDGDLMEGVASEAASIAGHLGLGKIVYLYDDNSISIGGSTDLCYREDTPARFKSYGWDVQSIDGHDVEAIYQALDAARAEDSKPSLICAKTKIGLGSPSKVGTSGVHGSPLGADELELTKKNLGWEHSEKFHVPESVRAFCAELIESKKSAYSEWNERFESWKGANAEKATELASQFSREVPESLKVELKETFSKAGKSATRAHSGDVIQVIAKHVPGFVGGSADLAPSTKTLINDSKDIAPKDFSGKNIRFGVREHAMGSMVNGMAYGQSWFPYSATFLVFADYMRPPMRLAALSKLQSLFIFTHDSYWVGEDGPTHQPIEHIASLRAIPNLYVFRPADGFETAFSYYAALEMKHSPSAILCTRQALDPLDREGGANEDDILKGAYVVSGEAEKDLVLVASGSEVSLMQQTASLLKEDGISARVVSVPCLDLFKDQSQEYIDSVIPRGSKRVLAEAGISQGWHDLIGNDALYITKEGYGASAPGGVLAEKFGFTAEAITKKIKALLA